MIRIVLLATIGVFAIAGLYAQAPVIRSVDKQVGASGAKVTLIGSNFGTNAAVLSVHFGAVTGTVLSVTDQLIETSVPAGATFDHITVTNTSTRLTGYSNDSFLLAYGGEHPFTTANLEAQVDFTSSTSGVTDLCMCDLDGDGKSDIAAVANPTSNVSSFTLLQNTSTLGALSFLSKPISLTWKYIHVRCGDLDGDGKPDLVLTRDGDIVDVFRNTSTLGNITLAPSTLTLTGKRPQHIEIADLDSDGKPEIILTDQGAGNVYVLKNTSTAGAISFDPSFKTIAVTGAATTDALAVEDINGDHLPDIIVGQFLVPNSNVFIIQNESTPGNLKLDKQTTLTVPGTLVNLRLGDLDGDNKPDIAATQYLSSSISLLRNTGSGGQIQFAAVNNIITETDPWGLDFGDLDGDGKIDIAVSSTSKKLTLLNNTSSPGNLSFNKLTKTPDDFGRHICIGDLDGDSKPDVAVTSTSLSKISVFRNKSCLVPLIDRSGSLTICSGATVRLSANQSAGVTYDWKIDGVSTGGSNYFHDATLPGSYTVTATSEGGSCIKTSNPVVVNSGPTAVVGSPVFAPPSPKVCMGADLSLGITSTNADEFDWTGPNGFTYTGNPLIINDFKAEYAGIYQVDIKKGTGAAACIAKQDRVIIEGLNMPDFKVGFTGAEVICSGDTKVLSVSPSPPSGFTYQWFETTAGSIAGETTLAYAATQSGEYYYQAQSTLYPACPAINSGKAKITVVTTPVVAFSSPAEACKGSSVQFTNQSTIDASTPATYSWAFGDGQTSASESPLHTFATAQTYNVKLTITYTNGSCPAELTKTIKISDAPVASITTLGNVSSICEGESLKLEVSSSFTSYIWSTTETTPAISITKAGTYTADVTNAIGCQFKLSKTITSLLAPQVAMEAQPSQITSGEVIQLIASGLVSYDWDPGKLVSDSTIANPTSLPLQTTKYTVTGKGTNGCTGKGSIEVTVKGEAIVNRLKPSNFFSPNGDAVNNVWSVDNILDFPQCMITIYDDKGIKLYEAKPYMNDWDGSSQSKLLPNGVYFYIIRCEGEEDKPKTGSITLIR